MSIPPRSRTGPGPLVAGLVILVIVAVVVAVLAAAGITPERAWDSFFPVGGTTPATDRSRATKSLYDIVFYIAAAIFVIVEGLIAFTVFRYRRKPGDQVLPPQIHGNNLVEVMWTAIPTAIVLFLFIMSWQTLNTVEAKAPSTVHVRAVAARFQWRFDYLDQAGATLFSQLLPVGADGGMVLPVGEPVDVTLKAEDVIHAFYVPKFLFKRDAVPGRVNEFSFTVDEPGTYRGQCAELCGAFHGSMVFEVHALTKPDFDAWFQAQLAKASAAPPSAPTGSAPAPSGSSAPAPSGSAAPAPSGSAAPAPSGSAPPPSGGSGSTLEISAQNLAYSTATLTAPAGAGFTIHFNNADDSVPHNVEIKDGTGASVFKGDIITGPAEASYQVPALKAGTYTFNCTVHPTTMTGTLTVQ